MYKYIFLLLILEANSLLTIPKINTTFPSTLSDFGYQSNNYEGYIFISNPIQGCTKLIGQNLFNSICLMQRGNCSFSDKIYNGQVAGCSSVLIYDNIEESLIIMNGDNPNITIPSSFISLSSGLFIIENNLESYYAIITYYDDYMGYTEILCIFFLISFSIIITCYYVLLCFKRKKYTINETSVLLETVIWSKDIEYSLDSKYDTCSICISSFSNREMVRELPCKHMYHIECITPWMNENWRCPLCCKDPRK